MTMNFFKYIKRGKAREPKPLRIEGVKTTMTPEPDDAELAAQALLESLASPQREQARRDNGKEKGSPEHGTVAYYQNVSDRIREAHEAEARAARRYVAYCEQRLRVGDQGSGMELPTANIETLAQMERGLYRYTDTVEREKGDLKSRWQHCLAEVIVRQTQTDTD